MAPHGKEIRILLVEDNPVDVLMTEEAFKQADLHVSMTVLEDGVAALAFLRQEKPYAEAPTPDLILLDLNLPKKDGRQVLAEIKDNPVLRRIPVAILTSSRDEGDILNSYDLHANCYIVKPENLSRFIDAVKSLESFWFKLAELPGK